MAQADGDPEKGKVGAVGCAGCHGGDGNSANPIWPNLAGQHPNYLEKQIADFKAGIRKDPSMNAMAAGIATPEAAADIAAYFAEQTMQLGTADPKTVALGQQLFRGGNPTNGVAACGGCHGPDGMGNLPAKFPRISGQNVDYVVKALKDFRSGTRTNDINGMMRGVAAHMTDAEIDAVAQYLRVLTK
jgi:cytochrome c553